MRFWVPNAAKWWETAFYLSTKAAAAHTESLFKGPTSTHASECECVLICACIPGVHWMTGSQTWTVCRIVFFIVFVICKDAISRRGPAAAPCAAVCYRGKWGRENLLQNSSQQVTNRKKIKQNDHLCTTAADRKLHNVCVSSDSSVAVDRVASVS